MTKKIAVINDLSGFGKCSLTAAIPVLSVLGIQCCPLPTAVLTGQTGYPYYHCTDLTDMIPKYTDAWTKNEEHFDGIYSGYLTGHTQIAYLTEFLSAFRKRNTFLLVDPVMGDDGTVYHMYSDELLAGMKKIIRTADLITPNLTEACLLSGVDFREASVCYDLNSLLDFAKDVGTKLLAMAECQQDIVITGIKFLDSKNSVICNLAMCSDGIHINQNPFFDKSYSGTGDLFSSIMCGCHLNGMSTADSMNLAGAFLSCCIKDTIAEQIPRNDGINFEKYLLYLIQEVSAYV